MSIIGLVGAGIGLASEIFKFLGDKQALKYAKESLELKTDLCEELEKPVYIQDDSKIETLTERIQNLEEIAAVQLKAYASKAK